MSSYLCPECFGTSHIDGVCRSCGFDIKAEKRPDGALPVGTILNKRYVIGRVLGKGGFGIVYRACNLEAGNICCVKEYAPDGSSDRSADRVGIICREEKRQHFENGLASFEIEAGAMFYLRDSGVSGIVRILDYFLENNTAYFTMEMLQGQNLNHLVRREAQGRLPFMAATQYILKVAKILSEVHNTSQMLHRDISPENIFVMQNDEIRIIDFGNVRYNLNNRQKERSLVLKPNYAPPEQFSTDRKTNPHGKWTDVYSLAGTYYYILTGEKIPTAKQRQEGSTYDSLAHKLKNFPFDISLAVDRALALDIQSRTSNMESFISDIVRSSALSVHPFVQIVEGKGAGKKIYFDPDRQYTLGRSAAEAEIVVDMPKVSRTHLGIMFDSADSRFIVLDNNSSNGTFLHGEYLFSGRVYNFLLPTILELGDGECKICLDVDYFSTGNA